MKLNRIYQLLNHCCGKTKNVLILFPGSEHPNKRIIGSPVRKIPLPFIFSIWTSWINIRADSKEQVQARDVSDIQNQKRSTFPLFRKCWRELSNQKRHLLVISFIVVVV
jgi:hypothetical protein